LAEVAMRQKRLLETNQMDPACWRDDSLYVQWLAATG
jgi:hypothetical protein